MATPGIPIEARLDDLTSRVERVEALLGLATRPERHPAGATPVPPATPGTERRDPGPPPVRPAEPLAPTELAAPAKAEAPAREPFRVERFIGARAFAIGGALMVLVGLGLFIKLAWDNGWIGPLGQVSIVAAFGVALLGAGEWSRRGLGGLASVGPSAAGLGALYFAGYAASEIHGLIPTEASLALLVLVSALGVGVSALGRVASLGAVALVGAYLAPFILRSPGPSLVFFPGYLLGIQAVGLCLVAGFATRPEARRFARLRSLAWWGTLLTGTIWIFDLRTGAFPNALVFVGLAWALAHAELLVTTRRAPAMGAWAGGFRARLAAWAVGSFSCTSWAAVMGVVALGPSWRLYDWLVPAALAVMAALVAGAAARFRLGALLPSGPPRDRPAALAAVMAAQAGALVVATVALGLDGAAQIAAWLTLGAGAAIAARRVRADALAGYGVVVLGIATAVLAVRELPGAFASAEIDPIAGLYFGAWSAQIAGAALAWAVAAWALVGAGPRWWGAGARACAFAAAAAVAVAPLHEDAHGGSLALFWTAIGVACLLIDRREERFGLVGSALLWPALAAIPWARQYADAWTESGALPGLHPGLGVAALAGAAAVSAARRVARGAGPSDSRLAIGALAAVYGVAIVFAASSLEVGRVAEMVFDDTTSRAGVLSIWWGLLGVGAIVGGFARPTPIARYAGLGLIVVAALKAVFFDLSQVSAAWRVASFIGLGLLLLGVAVGYAMIAAMVRAPDRDPGPGVGDGPRRPEGDDAQ